MTFLKADLQLQQEQGLTAYQFGTKRLQLLLT